ncbi:MAG: phosphotransferase, partial [Micromonosporaceae bacterium]
MIASHLSYRTVLSVIERKEMAGKSRASSKDWRSWLGPCGDDRRNSFDPGPPRWWNCRHDGAARLVCGMAARPGEHSAASARRPRTQCGGSPDRPSGPNRGGVRQRGLPGPVRRRAGCGGPDLAVRRRLHEVGGRGLGDRTGTCRRGTCSGDPAARRHTDRRVRVSRHGAAHGTRPPARRGRRPPVGATTARPSRRNRRPDRPTQRGTCRQRTRLVDCDGDRTGRPEVRTRPDPGRRVLGYAVRPDPGPAGRVRPRLSCERWVLCHGDLSPKHIFVTGDGSDGEAVHVSGIIDFGDWKSGAPVHD